MSQTPPERTGPLTLEGLYEAYGEFVHSLIARLMGPNTDPDDLGQDVWLVVLEKLPHVHTLEFPRAWLCRIVLNVVGNARRRKRVRRALGLRLRSSAIESTTPEAWTEARELTACLYRALDAMSEKKRTVFILFEMAGMSGQEIAEAMKCPVPTVHSRLLHARRELLEAFERAGSLPSEEGPDHV